MGFLQRLFGGGDRRLAHPVFGDLLLIRAKHGAYWEGETQLAGHPLTLAIKAPGAAEPVPAQVAFFERYTQAPDLAFHKGEDLLVGECEQWLRKPFPADWREAFAWVALSIPADGDELKPWDLSFECLQGVAARRHFTCYIERGHAVRVEVSG
ncbi:hypothetical protein LJR118_003395 [Acidovorax sp. LjRoot118]|uniref:hypothetical protein n=1 Tax=Acidovorax sp. LjRoot118 TaxID=3342256 RepID=UPI0015C756DC